MEPSIIATLVSIRILLSKLPPIILEDVLIFALNEIYTATPAKSLTEYLNRLEIRGSEKEIRKVQEEIVDSLLELRKGGVDELYHWFSGFKKLFPISEDEETPIPSTALHRSSPFAVFIRRSRLQFNQSSFDQVVVFFSLLEQWLDDNLIDSTFSTQFKLNAKFKQAKNQFDYHRAQETSLGFYDFGGKSLGEDRMSQPQYGLLNKAFIEFEFGGWETCLSAIGEAVHVARRSCDQDCLTVCSSLLLRLLTVVPALKSSPNLPNLPLSLNVFSKLTEKEIKTLKLDSKYKSETTVSPTDILYLLKQSKSSGKESLPKLFPHLYRAKLLHQESLLPSILHNRSEGIFLTPEFEAEWGFSKGKLWESLGNESLLNLSEKLCLTASNNVQVQWDIKLAIYSRRAMRLAEDSKWQEAIKMVFDLVDTSFKRIGMGIREITSWKIIVWDILNVKAELEEDTSLTSYIEKHCPLPLPHSTLSPLGIVSFQTQLKQNLSKASEIILQSPPNPILALQIYLTLHQQASASGIVQIELEALLGIINCRLLISGKVEEALRGKQELEIAWGRFLGLSLDKNDGGKRLLGLAWELRGRIQVVLGIGSGDDDGIVLAVEAFKHALSNYESLHLSKAIDRVLSTLLHLYDHLSLAPTLSHSKKSEFISAIASFSLRRRKLQLEIQKRESKKEKEGDWSLIREIELIIESVERAVLVGL